MVGLMDAMELSLLDVYRSQALADGWNGSMDMD